MLLQNFEACRRYSPDRAASGNPPAISAPMNRGRVILEAPVDFGDRQRSIAERLEDCQQHRTDPRTPPADLHGTLHSNHDLARIASGDGRSPQKPDHGGSRNVGSRSTSGRDFSGGDRPRHLREGS
jgi:hypothetical protein